MNNSSLQVCYEVAKCSVAPRAAVASSPSFKSISINHSIFQPLFIPPSSWQLLHPRSNSGLLQEEVEAIVYPLLIGVLQQS